MREVETVVVIAAKQDTCDVCKYKQSPGAFKRPAFRVGTLCPKHLGEMFAERAQYSLGVDNARKPYQV